MLHLTDVGTPPSGVDWVRCLNSGDAMNNGFAWWMANSGQLAFNDTRVIPAAGQNCAFLSISNKDLNTCNIAEASGRLFADPLPDGPVGPGLDFEDIFPPTNLQAWR